MKVNTFSGEKKNLTLKNETKKQTLRNMVLDSNSV